MTDELGKALAAIITILGLIFVGTFATIIFSQIGDQQCQSYKDTISQKDINIAGLNSQINMTQGLLYQCRNNYDELIKQNITKKDFEEIKGYYNITQVQINNLEQKFEQFNENYNSYYYVLIKNYKISRAINISIGFTLFGIEIFSLALLKSEFIWFVINAIRRKKHEEQKKEEPKKEESNK